MPPIVEKEVFLVDLEPTEVHAAILSKFASIERARRHRQRRLHRGEDGLTARHALEGRMDRQPDRAPNAHGDCAPVWLTGQMSGWSHTPP
jgi:hypothetical protein